MITGSIWEKEVFGKWLFARPFFWEDVFSMLVLALQTAYIGALLSGWGSAATADDDRDRRLCGLRNQRDPVSAEACARPGLRDNGAVGTGRAGHAA
jgi:hypothetical protein